MILFYSKNISGKVAILEEDEFLHCCKVLRRKEGDTVELTDGNGSRAAATITRIKKKNAELEILACTSSDPKTTQLTLAVSPLKNKVRWEWLLEKAVELGADTIIPLITHRTERAIVNVTRSNKIIRSAALQCLRTFHPTLGESIKFAEFMKQPLNDTDKYLAHYNSENKDLNVSTKSSQQGLILVGPEGDFTEDEVALALGNNYHMVNISNNRLRTETAAIIVVQELKNLGY